MTLVLGIESSCDETAAALVTDDACVGRRILAQRIASQDAEHAPYGGVVPEIAARAHAMRLAPLIAGTLADAGLSLDDVDAIAATAGPDADQAACGKTMRPNAPELRKLEPPTICRLLVRVIVAILLCMCHGRRTRVQRWTATAIGVGS